MCVSECANVLNVCECVYECVCESVGIRMFLFKYLCVSACASVLNVLVCECVDECLCECVSTGIYLFVCQNMPMC